MKYDAAAWHYGGDFPADLPQEAGATHTGMFIAWALLSGLSGELHTSDFPEDIPALRERSTTPGAFFLSACDGKFTDEDLSKEGNAFASFYYDVESGGYLADYESTLGKDLPAGRDSLYHIADTWENFDKIKPVLDRRLAEWHSGAG